MGTICAPSYVNIFMGKLESARIYLYITEKTIIYFRHIDHLFLIWKGTEEKLHHS